MGQLKPPPKKEGRCVLKSLSRRKRGYLHLPSTHQQMQVRNSEAMVQDKPDLNARDRHPLKKYKMTKQMV